MIRTPWRCTRNFRPYLAVILILLTLFKVDELRADSNRYWARYNGWQTTDFKLEGAPEDLAKSIKPKLALNGRRKIIRVERPKFSVKLLAEDLERIRLFLAQEGYPSARAVPTETAKAESRELEILITVHPGPRMTIGEITLDGWPERVPLPTADDVHFIKSGDAFRDESVTKSSDHLGILLLEAGYASVEITFEVNPVQDQKVDVIYSIISGDLYVIDGLEIVECPEDFQGVVRRVAAFEPGLDYAESRLTSLTSDLRWTQLFRRVDLNTRTVSPGHLMLEANLEKGRMKTLIASVGTWTDNPWMVEAKWTHRNLFTHGVGFDSRASLATHEANIGAGVFWLGWLSPRARTRVGYDFEAENEDAYKSREHILEISQSFRPNQRDALRVGITTSKILVETFNADPGEIPDAQGPMLELWSSWKKDLVDNPIFPEKGLYFKLAGVIAPPLNIVDSPYVAFQADLAAFHSLFNELVLTGRLRGAVSIPLGDSEDILANRRFYSGGFNTMRGYGRRGLGPQDTEGNPRGGQANLLAGVEMRFPIWGILEGAGFVDSGQVWRDYGEFQFDDLAVAAGLALDLRTPIGPIRVNRAWNIVNQQPGSSHAMWLAGIGYPW